MLNLIAQIALAAFLACSTQFLEGGARMNLGVRTALWNVVSEEAEYVGVNLVGKTIRNDDGILSGFTVQSYATLPFTFDKITMDYPWEVVIEATPLNTNNQGCIGGVGNYNGWSPIYFHTAYVYSFLNNVEWGGRKGFGYNAGEPCRIKMEYNGTGYAQYHWNNGWELTMTIPISKPVIITINQVTQIGTNRAQTYPFSGTWDLNKCYIKMDGKLLWEGTKGAYKRANS